MIATLRATFSLLKRCWSVAVATLVLLPLLGATFAGWLWIPEAHWWQLAFSLLLAILITAAAGWLFTATLASYREASPHFEFRATHVLLCLLWLGLYLFLWYQVAGLEDYNNRITGYLYAKSSESMRQSLQYDTISSWYRFGLRAIQLFIVPVLMLPLAAEWAARGWRGASYKAALRVIWQPRFLLLLACVALLAGWLPPVMTSWKPGQTFNAEMYSLLLRMAGLYILLLFCWL